MDWEPRIGMRVVCVDVRPSRNHGVQERLLVKGAVYTIRSVGRDPRINNRIAGQTDVWLNEVTRAHDYPYGAARFKPLRERKTSIAIFTAMLDHTPKELIPASYTMPGRPFE